MEAAELEKSGAKTTIARIVDAAAAEQDDIATIFLVATL
jgi:hypothetical protein